MAIEERASHLPRCVPCLARPDLRHLLVGQLRLRLRVRRGRRRARAVAGWPPALLLLRRVSDRSVEQAAPASALGGPLADERLRTLHPCTRVIVQSFQMISDQLRVFLSPQARTSSPSLARGTKSIVCIHVEFLPAGFASYGSWGL